MFSRERDAIEPVVKFSLLYESSDLTLTVIVSSVVTSPNRLFVSMRRGAWRRIENELTTTAVGSTARFYSRHKGDRAKYTRAEVRENASRLVTRDFNKDDVVKGRRCVSRAFYSSRDRRRRGTFKEARRGPLSSCLPLSLSLSLFLGLSADRLMTEL